MKVVVVAAVVVAVVVAAAAAAAEAGVAAGAGMVVVSRCGIASNSERKWEMYRTRRAKAARIYAHAGQRVQQNFFTRAQCAPSTLSSTRAYPRLTPALCMCVIAPNSAPAGAMRMQAITLGR